MNKNSRILITGAAGLCGYNLYLRLMREGYANVTCVFHKKAKVVPHEQVLMGDLTDETFCDEATKHKDCVFHLAAVSSGAAVMNKSPLVHVTSNVVMNARLMEAAYNNGVEKFVWYASTTGYPDTKESVVEDMMFDDDPYHKYFAAGWMKRYTEKLCELYSTYLPDRHMSCVTLRPSNIYGPHDKFDLKVCHVLPAMINKILTCQKNQTPLEIWGDGTELRDLIYIDDMVDATIRAAQCCESYEAINIGSGKTFSVLDIVTMIEDIVGYHPPKRFVDTGPKTIPCRRVCIDKAEETLNWKPKIGLLEGLERTIKWYKENYSV